MENPLFRKESLESITSPESLHDYLRITSPRLWMVLAAVAALAVGFLVYASTANLENTMPIQVEVESVLMEENSEEYYNFAVGTIPLAEKNLVTPGMRVRLGTDEGSVIYVYTDAENTRILVELNPETPAYPEGVYDAVLVLEPTTPISFLWN